MKISLEFLKIRAGGTSAVMKLNKKRNPFFSGISFYHPSTVPKEGTLYIAGGCPSFSEELFSGLENTGIVLAGPIKKFPQKIPFLHFPEKDIYEIFDELNELFLFYQEWSARVYEKALENPDLDTLMLLLNEVTDNPWYVADGSYRVLVAREVPEAEELSYIWRFLYRNRHLPLETVIAMEEMGKIEQMSKRRKAYIPTTEPFNIPFVSKSIYSGDNIVAHFYIIGVYTRPSQYEVEIAEFFGNVLNKVFEATGSYAASLGRYYDSFFVDLIKGVKPDNAENVLKKLFEIFRWKENDRMCVAAFSSVEKSGGTSGMQKIYALENNYDMKGFFYENHVIAIFNLSRMKNYNSPSSEVMRRKLFLPVSLETKSTIGLSEEFSGTDAFLDLGLRYRQAVYALSSSQNSKPQKIKGTTSSLSQVITFSSISLSYFRENIKNTEMIDTFFHPALQVLLGYDMEKHTDLYHTLRVYLENGRNVTDTAALLFIHRNTLLKRIQRITDLTGLDLEDVQTRNRLMISFLAK